MRKTMTSFGSIFWMTVCFVGVPNSITPPSANSEQVEHSFTDKLWLQETYSIFGDVNFLWMIKWVIVLQKERTKLILGEREINEDDGIVGTAIQDEQHTFALRDE